MFPQVPDAEYVHRFKADEMLRMTANVIRGPNAAFGISYATNQTVAMMSLPNCPDGLPSCDPYEIINWVGSRASITRPGLFNVFLLVAVENGKRRRWMDELQGIADGIDPAKGAFFSASHLFGRGRYTGLVEIVADDEELFFDLLLRSSDIEGVSIADPHFVSKDSQRGMGDPERDGASGGTPR